MSYLEKRALLYELEEIAVRYGLREFAIVSMGVTNGDSHDHAGGDGAQIDHGGVGGLSDDDHSQYLLAGGTRVLSGDWDIGNGRMVQADKIRARDGDGLALYEDGGSGIFVKDGGNVGIGTVNAGAKLEVDTTSAVIGQITKGASSQSANLHEFRNSADTVLAVISKAGAIGINTNDADNQDGISVGSAESGQIRVVGHPTGSLGGITSIKLLPKATGIGRWWLGALADDFVQSARRGNFEFYDINTKTPRFIIDSSGRMGINSGYTQPFTSALSVRGLTSDNSAGSFDALNSGGTSLLYVRNDGNVGIGTITPGEKLDVVGNIKVTGNFNLSGGVSSDFKVLAGNKIIIEQTGNNRNVSFASTSGWSDIGELTVYPGSSGNAKASLSVMPRGTGYSSTNKADISIYNTDYIADASNYECLRIRAMGTEYQFFSEKAGTGTRRPIRITAEGENNGGLYLTITGEMGIGTVTPSAKLAINGGLAVGEDADPGDNNLKVVGHAEIDGNLNHDGSNVGFYGTAPAAQHAAIADATDAGSAITQLNLVLATLRSLGLIAT